MNPLKESDFISSGLGIAEDGAVWGGPDAGGDNALDLISLRSEDQSYQARSSAFPSDLPASSQGALSPLPPFPIQSTDIYSLSLSVCVDTRSKDPPPAPRSDPIRKIRYTPHLKSII